MYGGFKEWKPEWCGLNRAGGEAAVRMSTAILLRYLVMKRWGLLGHGVTSGWLIM